MATFRNRHGKWQARVQRKGQRPVSKSVQSKEDAQRWARQIEAEIDKGSYTNIALAERTLFKDLINTIYKRPDSIPEALRRHPPPQSAT